MKALVIIDMLKGYMKDVHNPETIIKNQVRLIKAFKTQKLKVVLSIPDTKKTAQNPVMYQL